MVLGPRCLPFYFYPRPPRGGRPPQLDQGYLASSISIHALREEGDARRSPRSSSLTRFLSTPSARRATSATCSATIPAGISIHALREEGDLAPEEDGHE